MKRTRDDWLKLRDELFMFLPPTPPTPPYFLKTKLSAKEQEKMKTTPQQQLDSERNSYDLDVANYKNALQLYQKQYKEKLKAVEAAKKERLPHIQRYRKLLEESPFLKQHIYSLWFPVVMLDKDISERNAFVDLGFYVILCHFHVTQLLNTKVNFYCPSQDTRAKIWLALKDLMRVAKVEDLPSAKQKCLDELKTLCENFALYFETNWTSDIWLRSLTDIDRLEGNEGFFNTNNFTEAQIKKIGYTFLNGRKTANLYLLLMKFTETVLPHFSNLFLQSETAQGPIRNPNLYDFRTRVAKGQALFLKGFVKKISNTEFQVQSGTNDKLFYTIQYESRKASDQPSDPSDLVDGLLVCNCRYWLWCGKSCKHVIAVDLSQGMSMFYLPYLPKTVDAAVTQEAAPVTHEPSLVSSFNTTKQAPLPKTGRFTAKGKKGRSAYNKVGLRPQLPVQKAVPEPRIDTISQSSQNHPSAPVNLLGPTQEALDISDNEDSPVNAVSNLDSLSRRTFSEDETEDSADEDSEYEGLFFLSINL
jgi:hypothetical protein